MGISCRTLPSFAQRPCCTSCTQTDLLGAVRRLGNLVCIGTPRVDCSRWSPGSRSPSRALRRHRNDSICAPQLQDTWTDVQGFLSAFTHRKVQWGFLAISCLFYLYILFTLVITTRRAAIARNARVGQFFTAFSLYTLVVWALYPVVWVLGEGTQKVTVNTEIVLFAIVRFLLYRC